MNWDSYRGIYTVSVTTSWSLNLMPFIRLTTRVFDGTLKLTYQYETIEYLRQYEPIDFRFLKVHEYYALMSLIFKYYTICYTENIVQFPDMDSIHIAVFSLIPDSVPPRPGEIK